MNLLIVSHTPHYRAGRTLTGWGATVREIDQLSTLFDAVCHIAPVHQGPPPQSALPYASPTVRVREVGPAGGPGLVDKLRIPLRLPEYTAAIRQELAAADVVHVRCPANISWWALAVLKAAGWRGPLWIKYAGSWSGYPGEPWSYRLQRAWLRRPWPGAMITVNGSWSGQPAHVKSFYNPCLTEEEIAEARRASSGKRLIEPVRLLFVGRLDEDKGFPVFFEAVRKLRNRGILVEADVAGDGPARSTFEALAGPAGLDGAIRFRGWMPRGEVNRLYREAHFILLPSKAEGWPKVLSEAMAHGVVPLASNAGSIRQYLAECGSGRVIAPSDPGLYAGAIAEYLAQPAQWQQESHNATRSAERFGYEWYLNAVSQLLAIPRENSQPVAHNAGD